MTTCGIRRGWLAATLCLTAVVTDGAEVAGGALRQSLPLDGPWKIVFDPDNRGRQDGWEKAAQLERQRGVAIAVPSCWEETQQDYEGVAWYSRRFEPAGGWKGRHIRLQFDAVNYMAEIWLNDEVVGCHEGGYTPFEFDVTDLLEFDRENRLVVRVVGPAVVAQSVDSLIQNAAPHWRGGYVGGIWQSVRLLASAPSFVKDLFVEPDLAQGAATLRAEMINAGLTEESLQAVFQITAAKEPDRAVATRQETVKLSPGRRLLSVTLPIPAPTRWSPDNPHLYMAHVKLLRGGQPADEHAVRFGLREFTIRDGDFYLNGRPLFVKGAFWEGLYPSTLAHPRNPQIVRREITLAKQAGLNLLRPWRMPPAPMILDLADEMGILMVGSPPIECMGYWPAETPQLARRWTSEMQQMVLRDRNHPSIICWETSNEIIRRSLLRLRHPVSLAARQVDPTRLIIDESGGSRAPWGAHAYLPGQSAPWPILDHHIYLRSPVDRADYERLLDVGRRGTLTFVSEVGYGSLPDLPRNMARYRAEGNTRTPDYRYHQRLLTSLERVMDEHRLRDLFADASALCRASQEIQAAGNKLQLEALRINPAADGYCLHAFTDGDWVLGAGVLDLWREPKLVYQALKEVNAPLYLAIRCTPQNVYADRGMRLRITAVNEGAEVTGRLTIVLADSAGGEVWRQALGVRVVGGIQVLADQPLKTDELHGPLTLTARLEADGKPPAENRYAIFVLEQAELAASLSPVTLIDVKDRLRRFLEAHGIASRPFQAGQPVTGPVMIAASDAGSESELTRFVHLLDHVERGGTAVWLKPPAKPRWTGQPIYRDPEKNYMLRLGGKPKPKPFHNWLIETGAFPWKLESQAASGSWISVNHYTRPHRVFAGLPTAGFMGQVYQNVAPRTTLLDLPGEAIAGCVSWSFVHDYRGPQEAWHGSDLIVRPLGKGRMILSTLQLVDYLDDDPLADKLLLNLIGAAQAESGEVDAPGPELSRKASEFVERYRALRAAADSTGK